MSRKLQLLLAVRQSIPFAAVDNALGAPFSFQEKSHSPLA